jgi:hypothetical protein
MTPALQAAVGLEALAMFRRLGLPCGVTSSALCAQLGVTRSYAYEQRDRLRTSLERDPTAQACEACRDKDHAIRCHAITIAVLEYRATHPGARVEGRRTVYSDGLRELVMSLAEANAELEQVALADACRIPLPTFKQWRAQAQTNANAASAPPLVTNVQTPADPGAAPVAVAPLAAESSTTTPTVGFSLEMIRIIREYERWEGSLPAFVDHLRRHLDLHWGREHLTQLLHLAAARALLRRPPPAPSTRGSSFRPPPGVQWTSDGKQVKVVIDGQTVEVTWQPMVDVGSTATVGEAVRVNEDTAGVVAAFEEGVTTTGAAPRAMLLDNKACNTNQALRDALPDETLLMHATLGRPQNKAVVEGKFGLFAQDLGPVVAVVDTSTTKRIALTVAEAVTRAYAAGRNHRPRRKEGKTPYELYRDRDRSPETIAAAVKILRAIKDRIDQRAAREAAGRDPRVLAAFVYACTRFGFEDDGDLRSCLRRLGIESIEEAIAIYAAKLRTGSLPVDADNLRYFVGIANNCQTDRELLWFEEELVAQIARRGEITQAYLQRRAAAYAQLDPVARLNAIVDEILSVPPIAPVAHHFWRRCLSAVAATVPSERRGAIRRSLCERIRRRYTVTKQRRHALVDEVVRLLTPSLL